MIIWLFVPVAAYETRQEWAPSFLLSVFAIATGKCHQFQDNERFHWAIKWFEICDLNVQVLCTVSHCFTHQMNRTSNFNLPVLKN